MKLQPREQNIIGIAAILIVLIMGWLGLGDFGIEPQWKQFSTKTGELGTLNSTISSQEANIVSTKQQIDILKNQKDPMPTDKVVKKVEISQGETVESTKRSLLNDVIGMAQSKYGNILISIKPLPKPVEAAPPPTAAPAPAPGAMPVPGGIPLQTGAPPPGQPVAPPVELRLSDLLEEMPYEVCLRGSYSSLDDFLIELTKYPNVVELNRLEITPGGTDNKAEDPTKTLKATLNINFLIDKNI